MNIEMIKNKVDLCRGKKLEFRFNGARNQIEEFDGIIIDTYPSIFIVKLIEKESIKSFSYSDILIHKLIIKE